MQRNPLDVQRRRRLMIIIAASSLFLMILIFTFLMVYREIFHGASIGIIVICYMTIIIINVSSMLALNMLARNRSE